MSEWMVQNAWIIPLIPALSFVVVGLILARLPRAAGIWSIASIALSMAGAFLVANFIFGHAEPVSSEIAVRWFSMQGLRVDMGILIDPLSAVMLIVVTVVAFLVQVYSWEYMKHDPGFTSYYAYQSLFAASMLGLVLANNLVQMFVFWELVGLCSYLLIGFWFGRPSAKNAAEKAFITNRVGDFGFLLGILLVQLSFGVLGFTELSQVVGSSVNPKVLTIIVLLLLAGPVGKSAQFPLHVWLPDAMEGPTPVSALIHAATMVAAGVYFIARTYSVFQAAPISLLVVAYIGGFTAIFAATITVAQDDIKRILAYSTLSQLGYMIMAMGVGSMTAGMFHLTTHAFFKALLFLGAGSVIHALHDEQNIWNMGGLAKKMPVTTATFVIGALALSGIPPFSGFFSKDEILSAVLASGHTGLYLLGTLTAFLTAFYMFRLVFVAFFGQKESSAHESSPVITGPLVILAALSIAAGFLAPVFQHYLPTSGTAKHHTNYAVMMTSTLVAILGIASAWAIYSINKIKASVIASKFEPIYLLLRNKYYIDELYAWLGRNVVQVGAHLLYMFDLYVINGFVNGLAYLTGSGGSYLRKTETGQTQSYLSVMVWATTLLFIFAAILRF